MNSVLALSITVYTTFFKATVYFFYAQPNSITNFNATIEYLNSYYHYGGDGCTVEVTTTPWRYSIENIYEAVDFEVYARACNGRECESPVVMRARTQLRGFIFYLSNFSLKAII